MKILYSIQGTGNGHLSRARDIIPLLQHHGEVDILVSGVQADVTLPFPVKYSFRGLSFIFGKKGGVDLLETYKKSNLQNLFSEIKNLPVDGYDLVLNDFEPVSAWACFFSNKPCIALSHQAAVIHKKSPRPVHADLVGRSILKQYAPATAQYGFHFKSYDPSISTPVIRSQVRELRPANRGHYTVYLPAYNDERIIEVLSEFPDIEWKVFSKHSKEAYVLKNIAVFPISNDAFIMSMSESAGVLCGAGFETPAEAMFLGKKLMVVPMKNQYEQHCNAAALEEMGIPVLKSLKIKHCDKLKTWLHSAVTVTVDYPDTTAELVNTIIREHGAGKIVKPEKEEEVKEFTVKKFRDYVLKKILKG